MSTFIDANGQEWFLDIKIRHIEEVKRFCKGRDGKPIDLLEILERGNLERLIFDIEALVNTAFVICDKQVAERFNLADYDVTNAATYEMIPEWKTENAKIKASRWFGELINGAALRSLTSAFEEALVNFCQSESRQAALKKLLEKSRELERMQGDEMIQRIDEAMPQIQAEAKRLIQESLSDALSGNLPESSESTLPPTASGS